MEQQNDVWGTLRGIVGDVGSLYLKDQQIKATTATAKATSAPVAPAPANQNPFAGMWSAFPQNDTKEQYQNQTPWNIMGAVNPLWFVLLGLVGLLFVMRR